MNKKVIFARPTATAAISVTGSECGLNCAHCGARYLKAMRPPEEALAAFSDPIVKSALISGGSDIYGHVPLDAWPERIRRHYPHISINCHTGIASDTELTELSRHADVISFDYISDERIIGGIYGSGSSAADYIRSFVSASNALPTVPHITVGLLGPELEPEFSKVSLGEIRALADSKQIPEPPAVVIIVFRPTSGTRMQDVRPPGPEAVCDVIREAKSLFPSSPVCVGCMRPSGNHRSKLDAMALAAGADIIVMPSSSAVALARMHGIEVSESDECCVFPALAQKAGKNG